MPIPADPRKEAPPRRREFARGFRPILVLAGLYGSLILLQIVCMLVAWSDGAPNRGLLWVMMADLTHMAAFAVRWAWLALAALMIVASLVLAPFRTKDAFEILLATCVGTLIVDGSWRAGPQLVRYWESKKLSIAIERGNAVFAKFESTPEIERLISHRDQDDRPSPGFRASSTYRLYSTSDGVWWVAADVPSHLCSGATIYYSSIGQPLESWHSRLADGWFYDCH